MTRAFTLIEQLAAVTLASLFMAAGFAVLGRLSHDRTGMSRAQDLRMLARAADLIEWDLGQSARFRSSENGAVLAGFGSLDDMMKPTHRPVRIEYRITKSGNARRLIRSQTNLDVLSNRSMRKVWVCDAIDRIELTPLSAIHPTTRPVTELFGPADGLPVADVMRLVLVPTDGSVPSVTRICHLR